MKSTLKIVVAILFALAIVCTLTVTLNLHRAGFFEEPKAYLIEPNGKITEFPKFNPHSEKINWIKVDLPVKTSLPTIFYIAEIDGKLVVHGKNVFLNNKPDNWVDYDFLPEEFQPAIKELPGGFAMHYKGVSVIAVY